MLLMSSAFFVYLNNLQKGETASGTQIGITLKVVLIAKGLQSPVEMAVPKDGSGRMFIVEQLGRVRIIQNGKLLVAAFLDLQDKIVPMNDRYSERGLLGIAFHPDFKSNKKFYVYYSSPSGHSGSNHKSVIAEYKESVGNPNLAESSGRIVFEIEEPEANHNGGHMAFGHDGYLYVGLGDGGGAGDEHGELGNGQNLQTLLGKIIRIDVNTSIGYNVPADNPFIGKNARPEIWAYGLRNPWKFSFDRVNGRLFCADVGQDKYEEVDLIEKGKNYGWRIMEGLHCYNPSNNCNQSGLTKPIYEYDHQTGISIIGGYVYRGKAIPDLMGKYIFGDWTGPVFALEKEAGIYTVTQLSLMGKPKDTRILSFGEDEIGELYLLTSDDTQPLSAKGAVYKIIR